MKPFKSSLAVALAWLILPFACFASDWSAFSIIEKNPEKKEFKETVLVVNESKKTITLSFPNFQFIGHEGTPARSVGPMGDVVLAPGEAYRLENVIPFGRENGFADSISIQDIVKDIPIKRIFMQGSRPQQ